MSLTYTDDTVLHIQRMLTIN